MRWIFSCFAVLLSILPVSAWAWTINAQAPYGLGTVSPSGAVTVADGASQTITISPYNSGLATSYLKVDSVYLPRASSYTFNGVTADHTLIAAFTDLGSSVKGTSDSFDDGYPLHPKWIYVSPNADSSLSLPGNGMLRLTASPKNGGSDYAGTTNRNAPRLLQFNGFTPYDWEVETKILFPPDPSSAGFQGVAVIACPSAAISDFSDCWRIAEMDHLGPGNDTVKAAGDFVPFSGNTVHFKLQRYGQVYKGWYSSNGTDWIPGGEFSDPANIYYLGIMAMRQSDDGDMTQYATAEVDYFKVSPVYNTTVTLAGSGSGSVSSGLLDCSSGSCSARFLGGTVLNFQPSPVEGTVFAGWTGCDTVTGEICTVNVASARSVRGFFNRVVGHADALTDNNDNDDNPNIVRDSNGALHLAYAKTGSIYYRKKIAGIWSADEVVASGAYPAMAVDLSGTPHVTYVSGNSVLYTNRSGGVWQSPQYVAVGQKSNLDLDDNGKAYIVLQDSSWNPAEPSDYYNEIYYTNNIGGSFAPPTKIADGAYVGSCLGSNRVVDFFDPVIKVGTPGGVHIVYRSYYKNCYNYSEGISYWSSATGTVINSPAQVTYSMQYGYVPPQYMYLSSNALSLDAFGNIYVAYFSSVGSAYVGRITGGAWMEESFPGTAATVGGSRLNSAVNFAFVNAGAINFSSLGGGFPATSTLGIQPFSPQSLSLSSAADGSVCMAITGDDGNDNEIYLVTGGASATASAASKDFGALSTGAESANFAFTIRNTGSQPLDVTRFSLAGADSANFRIKADSCGAKLPSAAECSVSVSFAPVSAGVKTAAVAVGTSDPDAATIVLGLLGAGITPPETSITAAPTPWSGSTTAGFSFDASEAGWGFRCRLDGGADAACVSPLLFSGLAEGSHTFEVFASNGAGIVDSTPATFSWTISLTAHTLSIAFPGTGQGTVMNTVYGISCNTGCSLSLPAGTEVLLSSVPGTYSLFDGWSGACTGNGDCLVKLLGDRSVAAAFTKDLNHMVRISSQAPEYFPALQEAYDVAPMGSTIELWGTEMSENSNFNRNVSVILKGGYDSTYMSNDGQTIIRGSVAIKNGKITMNRLVIRPPIK